MQSRQSEQINTNIEECRMSTILALVSEFEGLKFSEDF